jgi:hypothetical protein
MISDMKKTRGTSFSEMAVSNTPELRRSRKRTRNFTGVKRGLHNRDMETWFLTGPGI